MIYGYPIEFVAGAAGVVVILLAYGAWALFARRTLPDDDEFPPRDEDGSLPDVVDLEPPTLRGSRFGVLGEVIKTWWYLNKTERLAGKGYVRWFLVDDTFPKPRFVKPEDKGTGIREYEHDGGVYLFPREAAKPSAETGMWTYVHQAGDAEPINVHDHREEVMSAEQVKEWLTQGVSADRPGKGMFHWLTDLSDSQMIAGAIGLAVLVAVIFGQMGGA